MMTSRRFITLMLYLCLYFVFGVADAMAQSKTYHVDGKIMNAATHEPLGYVAVKMRDIDVWAISDENGYFKLMGVPSGYNVIEFSCLGYVSRQINIRVVKNVNLNNVLLKEDNLLLSDVEVTAKRKSSSNTTSYTLDRTALDHAQILNVADVQSLLPGGKTIDTNLTDDSSSRFSLRSMTGEKGNAAFGTAVEIDGLRMDNNSIVGELLSTSTRNIASSNIESVEVISGIPSVEYGDISNGMIKINSRKGKSPFIIEASMNAYTRQISFNKGFALHNNGGVLNISLEHANSFKDLASPYTSYNRNVLTANYSKTFHINTTTLNLQAGLTGNIGGYNSEADPDMFSGTYSKVKDNQLRGNLDLNWLMNSKSSGVFNVMLHAAFSMSNKLTDNYTNCSSSSAQPCIHAIKTGYFLADMGNTGYWYEREINDQKPLSMQLKLKGEWSKRFDNDIYNNVMLGAELNSSRNNGQGEYYKDTEYIPTWRPYVYKDLPTLNNIALFAENKMTIRKLVVTAGLRNDMTLISGSDYGTVSSISPRVSARYDAGKSLKLHAGIGKAVKLPSFQVLYPKPAYSDTQVFSSGSTTDNKSYYAYYTNAITAKFNSNLKWQYSNQIDLGFETKVHNVDFSVSGYWSRTKNPYEYVNEYTPFAYNYTSQKSIEALGIASENRSYSIDSNTGLVTVTDASTGSSYQLASSEHYTYNRSSKYINGSPVTRYGIEWIVNIPITKANKRMVGLSVRFDGNYYHYKGVDEVLIAGTASSGVGDYEASSGQSPLIGYYLGNNVTSTSTTSVPSASNGSLNRGCDLNTTFTAHIPKARLIMTLKIESSLYNYKKNLSESSNGTRGIVIENSDDVFGTAYTGKEKDCYVAVYPEYYSTWQNPEEKIPFAQALTDAYNNDKALYEQLCKLIVRTSTSYYFNPNRISAYYSCNFSVTKEIGRHISISMYANNFLNSLSTVKSTQTNLESSLYNSSYIPKFYYGMSVRLKL